MLPGRGGRFAEVNVWGHNADDSLEILSANFFWQHLKAIITSLVEIGHLDAVSVLRYEDFTKKNIAARAPILVALVSMTCGQSIFASVLSLA